MGKPHIVVIGVAISLIVAVAIVVSLILTLPGPQPTPLIAVTVSQGVVVGKVLPEGGAFYGIPFSQSPEGEYRWRKPRDPLLYDAPYWNATYKRPGCQQICDQPVAEYSCPHAVSEDCLYLNVWIPSRLLYSSKPDHVIDDYHYQVSPTHLDRGELLPIMVWFYGGNFLNGAGSCVLYDGRFMAERGDVIIVTTNYRVAHFGFLVQGELPEEGQGNFGFWDQVKTLEWVRDNIASFGGNPGQVTLFGQSAGAESIGVHLTSSVSEGLFHRAIMQSNPFGLPLRNLTDAREFGREFTIEAGCPPDDMACMRLKSVEELEAAFNATATHVTDPSLITLIFQPWSPVIDWDVVPAQPIDHFMQGKAQKKPMMLGATVDEGMIFVAEAFPQPMNDVVYNALLLAVFKKDFAQVAAKYPGQCPPTTEGCDNRVLLDSLATEYLFQCPQRKALNASDTQRWWYIFNQTWSFYEAWEEPLCYDRVCHAAELAYLFNVENLTRFDYTNQERALSTRVLTYWTNFAKHGDPNLSRAGYSSSRQMNKAVTGWRGFDGGDSAIGEYEALQLAGEGDFMMTQPYHDICDFWDDVDEYADHYTVT